MLALLYFMTTLVLGANPRDMPAVSASDDPASAFVQWVHGASNKQAGVADPPTDPAVRQRTSPGYRYTGDFWPQIAQHVTDMPGRVRPEQIGTSLGGRPIWAFHIQNPGEPIDRKILI
ncbi:MAG: hypothetical protein ACI9MC_001472, partial [Kiritimatiellia bacterium]